MANPFYKRVSADQQSTARQNLVLDEAGIEDLVVFEEQAGTSSRLHRPKFRELLTYARPGDVMDISEMFRLALRIHDSAFSAMHGQQSAGASPDVHFAVEAKTLELCQRW